MEPAFLKERLERFLKIIPADYKLADTLRKSPKGFTCTIERVGKSVKGPKIITEEDTVEQEEKDVKKKVKEVAKSKKKSLDETISFIR